MDWPQNVHCTTVEDGGWRGAAKACPGAVLSPSLVVTNPVISPSHLCYCELARIRTIFVPQQAPRVQFGVELYARYSTEAGIGKAQTLYSVNVE